MLIVLIPCQSKNENSSLTCLDPHTFYLLNTLYYTPHISICKPNHLDLMSCLLESNWVSFNLFPLCSHWIYDYLKKLKGPHLQNQHFSLLFFSFCVFWALPLIAPTSQVFFHPVFPWSSVDLDFRIEGWVGGVEIIAHGNDLVIAFLLA